MNPIQRVRYKGVIETKSDNPRRLDSSYPRDDGTRVQLATVESRRKKQ